MKRLIAIMLVFLVLLNALGFYGILMGLEYKSGLELVARLDNHKYHENETVTLKVPMPLPYHIDNGTFERVNGQLEHQGEYYRLVKQKLEKDTLYIVCIKDQDSKDINQALSDYVKTFTDKPANTKQNTKVFAGFMKDFLPPSIGLSSASEGWNYGVYLKPTPDFFSSVALGVFSPPPQG